MAGMTDVTRVMRAVKSGVIRQEAGKPRIVVTAGETTAHAGHEIVRDHPHLWAPIGVDYAAGDFVDDAIDAAQPELASTEAIRTLLAGLVERGYALPDPDGVPSDEVPAMIVRIFLNNLPPAGDPVNEESSQPVDEAVDDDEPGFEPIDAEAPTDPETKEGRQVIRDWAVEHGYEVHASGPLPAVVLDAWKREQG